MRRKLLEKLIFNSVFNFIDTRNMLSVHQSGFCPSESSVHQLISIVHNIYNAFDANPGLDVRGVFLDFSKTLDRMWHYGLLYKVKCMGIDRIFQKFVKSFLMVKHLLGLTVNQVCRKDQYSVLYFFLFTSMIDLKI